MRRFRLVLLCLCLLGPAVFAAPGDEHSFELSWQADGFHKDLHAAMDRTEPFEKEPDTSNRDVHRGVLHCGDLSNNDTPDVGFLWDKSEGKLYIDLNRDSDLTNDPDGVLVTEHLNSGRYINQSFPHFQLTITTDTGEHCYQLSAQLYSYPGFQNANFYIHSGYEGNVELADEKWGFQIVDPLRCKIKNGDSVTIWTQTGSETNRIDSLRLLETLYLYDHCYAVNFEFKAGDDNKPQLSCKLTEKEVPLGKLKLDGKGISQLVFDGAVRLQTPDGNVAGAVQTLVLPRLSDEVLTVPVGEFRCKQLALKPQGNMPTVNPQNVHEIQIPVEADTENVLKVGAPLNHTVKVERSGRVLKFDYQLIGAGGETYDFRAIAGYASDNKPKVSIYKGDMQLATGEFEFG